MSVCSVYVRAVIMGLYIYALCPGTSGFAAVDTSARIIENFNADWLFSVEDVEGGEAVQLPETDFAPVCLPHTVAMVPHTSIDTSSFAMISWYRKHFRLPKTYRGKCIRLSFEGVAKAATVYCNGKKAGEYRGAYTPFICDITESARCGADNVLAVRVDSRQRKDLPPEGMNVDYMLFGGIVRDVALIVTDRLYVDWVYAMRDTLDSASVDVGTRLCNTDAVDRSCILTYTISDLSGTVVATASQPATVSPDSGGEFHAVLGPVKNLRLWHPDHPSLYRVTINVGDSVTTGDDYTERFGMRTVSFGKSDGVFRINGEPLKLRGLNRHETFPVIGRAAANRLQARDAEIIKYDFGCNIVRCSHYPQDPAFLNRCDEIGLLVLEEMAGWNFVSNNAAWQNTALQNLETMVMRDRNHPSVISFGVRINQSADFHQFYSETNRVARTLAPDRPTHGVRVQPRGMVGEFLEDVWAQNFVIPVDTPPVLPWITTESVGHNFPAHSWDPDERLLGQMLAHAAVQDSAAANPNMAGILGWCAFDYNSAYRTSENSICYHGVADIWREPKPAAYFYRSQADIQPYGPMAYIAHSWERALPKNDIWVVSNCDSVELFVNGSSKGKKAPSEYRSLRHPLYVWRTVPFVPGELRAVGYVAGKAVVTFIRRTPGKPTALTISADDTLLETGGDMTRVVVTVVDRSGQAVPRISRVVRLKVVGPAEFSGETPIALENGKTAFFIKTRSRETGRVTCSVKGDKLRAAKTYVVVKDRSGEEIR
jgi:beta-galactosidase